MDSPLRLDPSLSMPAFNAGNPGAGVRDQAQARKAAEDFEAMAITQMLQPMFEGLSAEAPFGGGQGELVMRTLLLNEYGKSIAAAGGIGLADAVYAEILKMQGL